MSMMIDRHGTYIEKRAQDYVRRLRENVELFYSNHIGYEEFTANQRVIWDAIHNGVKASQIDADTETRILEILRAR
jgi:hypothetical protein